MCNQTEGSITWRCTQKTCQAQVCTDEHLQVTKVKCNLHDHPRRSDEYFKSKKLKQGIKRRISNDPTERPQKAIDLELKDVDTSEMDPTDLAQFADVAKRKKLSKKPKQPKSIAEFKSTWENITCNNNRSIEGAYLVQEYRDGVVMIASDKSLALIRGNNKQAFGDGTSRYAPKGYYQMYTFHIHVSNTYVQVAYFLLLNKTLKTYVTMFEMLKERCGTVEIFQLDFEVGVHTAIKR